MSVVEQTGDVSANCGRAFGRRIFRSALVQLRAVSGFFIRPAQIIHGYHLSYLQFDFVAGLTVAVVALPQAMAYALVAELPPQMGLYSVVVGAIIGALWGSSDHLQTGPTNTTSLLVLSVLLGVASPDTPEYLVAAGLMALMVGVFRLGMGLARLGVLVNFVSDAVIVGFTAGAGVLIFFNQIRHLLRLSLPSTPDLWETLPNIAFHLSETHWPSLAIGFGTIVVVVVLRKINHKLPSPLIGMGAAAVVVWLLCLDAQGVRVVGELPRGFPPLTKLSLFDLDLISKLMAGSMVIAAIGLVEATSIARSIAGQSGQCLDSNQEFVGQGLANIACGFFSGYTCAGSFTRSAVNFEAGAKTTLSSAFCGIFVLVAMLVLAPLVAYVPLAALAGVLILTAFGLVDRKEMARIWRSGHGDRVIMVVTLLATLVLSLEIAVMAGIVLSVGYYLLKTSTPRVHPVLLSDDFRYFAPQPGKPSCPQLGVVEIKGDLYFGAVNHVEKCIQENLEQNPTQRFLLLRMYTVERCDISGIHTLESIVRTYRDRGGDVYFVHVQRPVLELMQASGFCRYLGEDHFLDPDETIRYLFYKVLDPAICIYECPVRVFKECQNLPKHLCPADICWDTEISLDVPSITPQALWDALGGDDVPAIIDVREPREFKRGRIPHARLVPLPILLAQADQIPRCRPVVLVCRGGRRSTRATAVLRRQGYDKVKVLEGGMLAWEHANLLEAVG